MQNKKHLIFGKAPSMLKYMFLATIPKKNFKSTVKLPKIKATWLNCKPNILQVSNFTKITGIESKKNYHPLFLHTFSFRLLMTIITNPKFSVPIWKLMQIRNVITNYKPLAIDKSFDFVAKITKHNILEKGIEIDITVSISKGNEVIWKSLNTFYVRGKFGKSTGKTTQNKPRLANNIVANWTLKKQNIWKFVSLTGDCNGAHIWSWYARILGFKTAFSHAQRVLGQAISRVSEDNRAPFKIETWIKGPVYYNSELELKMRETHNDKSFFVHVNNDERPAIIGRCTYKN